MFDDGKGEGGVTRQLIGARLRSLRCAEPGGVFCRDDGPGWLLPTGGSKGQALP